MGLITSFVFFLFVGFIYLRNATQDVYSGDIGDLVTASYVFGIPHPPGYPLLTFLGFIFTHLPIPVPVVTKMAYVSVLASIIGLVFFYIFCLKATKERFIAILSTSILAFSYPFWLQSEIPEVFALSHSLLIIIFFFAIKFYEGKKLRYLYLTLFFMGLSLTNQHAIIAVFPGVALLLLGGIVPFRHSGLARIFHYFNLKKFLSLVLRLIPRMMILLKGLGAFLLGLLPYIYVPIASFTNPKINWLGGEATVQNFIWLVSRAGYFEDNPFEGNVVGLLPRFLGLKVYAQYFINHYSIIVALLCLIGILALLKNKKLLLLSLLSGFIISGPLFIFTIFPAMNNQEQFRVLERFYTHSFIVFLMLLPFCLHYILQAIRRFTHSAYSKLFLLPLFVIPFVLFLQNFPRTNLSQTNIGNNLGRDVLLDLPYGSAVFLENDSVMFNTWYMHHVLGERNDIELIHPLTGERNVFYKKLLANYMKSHPREKDYSPQKILPFLLVGADEKKPIFFNYNQQIASADYVFVPHGLLLQLVRKNDIPSYEQFLKKTKSQIEKLHIPSRDTLLPSEQNLLTPNITRFYSRGLSQIGNFINVAYDDAHASIPFYSKAIEVDREDSSGFAGLGYAYSQSGESCVEAQKMLEKAISLNPFYASYYTHLYQVLKECKAGSEDIGAIKNKYESLFKKDINKEPFWKYKILIY